MNIKTRIKAFSACSKFILDYVAEVKNPETDSGNISQLFHDLHEAVIISNSNNQWFTKDNILFALQNVATSISEKKIKYFLSFYEPLITSIPKLVNVGVVMAGNVPMVGFHDLFCVLMSGNRFVGKLSSDDQYLLPAITRILIKIEPAFEKMITFCEDKLTDFDAVIATGSTNTSRYFEYYFARYPHIIRKNRNGVGVITGNETLEEIKALADDIFIYFGLGCRNVSKIFIPEGYDPIELFSGFNDWQHITNHHKYRNNYDYYKSVYMINQIPVKDNGFVMLKEDIDISSPISVVYYEYYKDPIILNDHLNSLADQIQCIVSGDKSIENSIPFGSAQSPALSDFADGVDTMEFLLGL